MSSIGGSGKSMLQGPVSAKKQARAPLQGEPKQEAGAHSADPSMDFGTDQKQDRRPSGPKNEEASSKTSHASGLSMGAPKIPSLSMSVRGQHSHTTGQQTEPLYSNPKKRPAFESVTAGSLSTAKSTQQGPEAKKLKLENDSEEAAEREILRLRGGAKGHHRKSTANRSSPAAEALASRGGAGAAASATGTSQASSAQASESSSQANRARTLPAALPASKPSSDMKSRPASISAAQNSAVASSSEATDLSSRHPAQALPAAASVTSTSTKKSAWGSPIPSASTPTVKSTWGASTSAAVKSSAGSANSAMVREGERKIPAAHPKAAEAKREKINNDLGVRLERPDQHIARPSIDFNREADGYDMHVKNHPELLEPGFSDEAKILAKSECSKASPAWRYPEDIKSINPRENRSAGDALKVGRHRTNGRPMAVVVTGPSTIKTAFYLTYIDRHGKVVDYADPLTYFNKNAKSIKLSEKEKAL